MDKILYAEYLVDSLLLDQHFSVQVELSNLKGAAEVEWSTCYHRRCRPMPDQFNRDECKLECQRRAYMRLVSKLGGARAKCRYDRNPAGCAQTITDMQKTMRDKVREIRGEIYNVRRSRAVHTAGTRGGGAGAGVRLGGGGR